MAKATFSNSKSNKKDVVIKMSKILVFPLQSRKHGED